MSIIPLLLIIGLITYWILRQSVADVTRTPVWLLWLVMMAPAITWTTWSVIYGEKPIPPELVIIPFAVCLPLYLYLVQRGRVNVDAAKKVEAEKTNDRPDTATNPIPEILVTNNLANLAPITARLLTSDEEATLKTCFPWSVYYVQTIDYSLQAAICKGQLRTDPEKAYATIQENVAEKFGDRFLVMLQDGADDKPFFAIVSNPHAQKSLSALEKSLYRPGIALALLAATLFTTTVMGVAIAGITEEQLTANSTLWFQGCLYSIPLLTILGVHELAHYLTARAYKVQVTLPYFIPVPFFLGTFGAFIQTRSPIPNRKALFDISIAGPMAGLVATLPFLLWGLAHSQPVPMPEKPTFGDLQAFNPTYTLLLAVLSKLMLGNALMEGMALKLHPMAIAGCLGLVVTALNLMPVGQLDGGHIVHAMVGQRKGAIIGRVTRVLMLLLCIRLPDFLLWAVLLFLMPSTDEPALNDVTELDNQRDLWGLVAIAALLVIILPPPAAITRLLF